MFYCSIVKVWMLGLLCWSLGIAKLCEKIPESFSESDSSDWIQPEPREPSAPSEQVVDIILYFELNTWPCFML